VFHGTRYDEELEEIVDEGLFIGTAGHCIFDEATDATVWAEGQGLETRDADGQRVGESIFGIDMGSLDFGLIRIDDHREEEVDPSVCHFGGPVAMATQRPAGTLVHHFGNGTAFGETVQGRTGRVDHYSGGGSVMNFTGAASPGDSGSSVIDEEGNAVGILVRLAPGGLAGYVEATDLEHHVALAEDATGIDLELVTADFA
jgi:S1-C subfamily serine protease